MATPLTNEANFPKIEPKRRYDQDFYVNYTLFFNPKIIEESEDTEVGLENCPSVPNFYAYIRRSKTINLSFSSFSCDSSNFSYFTPIISNFTVTLSGTPARVAQRCMDSLQKAYITDNLESSHLLIHKENKESFKETKIYRNLLKRENFLREEVVKEEFA